MRAPLLLLLALLALLATVACAEESQQAVRTRFRDIVQALQGRITSFQESAIYQQVRELAEAGIGHAQDIIERVKTQVSNLLERNPA